MATEQAPSGRPDGRTTQPPLPLPERRQAADEPIPYALTARARRTVAPSSLPDLSVVPRPDPFDPRPARARALRRAGRDAAEIAARLDVDEALVADWCRAVGPRADRRRQRRAAGADGRVRALRPPQPDRAEPDRAAVRARGADEAAAVLGDVGGAAATAVAWLAGRATVTAHAATVRVDDPELAGAVVRRLEELTGIDRSRVRLVVEVGPDAAGDLVAGRWSAAAGVPREHVAVSRSTGDGVRATLRIGDPEVAARLAGWQRAVAATLEVSGVGGAPG